MLPCLLLAALVVFYRAMWPCDRCLDAQECIGKCSYESMICPDVQIVFLSQKHEVRMNCEAAKQLAPMGALGGVRCKTLHYLFYFV